MFGSDDLGLDLGTSTVHIVVRGKGIVLSEPAYVAYAIDSRKVVAVGEEARSMYGKTPSTILVERPLRGGQIFSYDLVTSMIRYMIRKVIGKRTMFRPRILVALPGGLAPSERGTLEDIIYECGVRNVESVDESVVAAIGAELTLDQPYGRMIIDIGGGRTNVSVFSYGHQIIWNLLPVCGDRFDEAIIEYLRRKHSLLIGERTAENLKINIGSAQMRGASIEATAYGRSLVTGLPRTMIITSDELNEALADPIRELISSIHRIVEHTPPELASDIFEEGIMLSGGGAKLFGLDRMITDQLNIRTVLAEEPEYCTAHGLEELMGKREKYKNVDRTLQPKSDMIE